jgi:predicted pyridoxine 5'-phosphate oxidase superfamily flavin-nucleotide-binding protein
MGILTEDMKRVVREQQLGFVATVCPDGTPNLSPKGTTTVWDDDHLVFADIRSPGTTANLRLNPILEINVVDPIVRKGYRFKGMANVLTEGPLFDEIRMFYEQRNSNNRNRIRAIILVKVERALPLFSPAYDLGMTEEEVRNKWQQYYDLIHPRQTDTPVVQSKDSESRGE